RLAGPPGLGRRGTGRSAAAHEHAASPPVHATPATGHYRPNPAVNDGDYSTAALTLRRRSEGFAVRRDVAGEATLEFGERYTRLSGTAHLLVPVGAGASRLLTRVQVGLATRNLPPY